MLTPARVNNATMGLKTCLVNQAGRTYRDSDSLAATRRTVSALSAGGSGRRSARCARWSCGLTRRLGCGGAEAARRVREVLRHDVVVRLDLSAVERDRAGNAVALVEVARREDVVVADLRSGDREPVEGEPDDVADARVLNAAAQRVVVVLARDLRMAVATVLDLPRAGVPPARVEGVEQRDAGRHHTHLAAHATGLCGDGRSRVEGIGERLRRDLVRVAVVLVCGVGGLDGKDPGRVVARQVIRRDHAVA